jgi:hypothetical protein
MRGGQEEPDCLQGLQAEEVPHGRHVKVWLQVRINLHNHLQLKHYNFQFLANPSRCRIEELEHLYTKTNLTLLLT